MLYWESNGSYSSVVYGKRSALIKEEPETNVVQSRSFPSTNSFGVVNLFNSTTFYGKYSQ